MEQFPRLAAARFVRELDGGATKPCVFDCVPPLDEPDGDFGPEPTEYVVKFRSEVRGQAAGLRNEYVAAQLALALGIPIPAPALILLGEEVLESLDLGAPPSVAARSRRSAGLNFGTRFLSPGFSTWIVDAPIPAGARRLAAEVFAFDALTENVDRRREKPNLLSKGDSIFVFDHELAFSFIGLVGSPGVGPDRYGYLRGHPFYSALRGCDNLELERFEAALAGLEPGFCGELCASIPDEFAGPGTESIGAHIESRRTAARSFIQDVKGVLR